MTIDKFIDKSKEKSKSPEGPQDPQDREGCEGCEGCGSEDFGYFPTFRDGDKEATPLTGYMPVDYMEKGDATGNNGTDEYVLLRLYENGSFWPPRLPNGQRAEIPPWTPVRVLRWSRICGDCL